MNRKNIIMIVALLLILGLGIFFWLRGDSVVALPENNMSSSSLLVSSSTSSTAPQIGENTSSSVKASSSIKQTPPKKEEQLSPTDACIEAKLSAGATDVNAILQECVQGFSSP